MAVKRNKKQASLQPFAGLFLSGMALLLFLSIVSYHPDDPVTLSGDGLIQTGNWLGPAGAVISWFFIQWTFGYAALIIPTVMFAAGLHILGKKLFQRPLTAMAKSGIWMLWLSVGLALPRAIRASAHLSDYFPAGLIGGWLAEHLVLYTGYVGAVLIYLFLFVLLLSLTINMSFDAILLAGARLKNSLLLQWKTLRQSRQEKRAARRKARQEKKKTKSVNPEKETKTVTGKVRSVPEIEEPIEQHTEPFQPEISLPDTNEAETPPATHTGSFEPETEETVPSPGEFEMQAPVEEDEVDYDDLVRESIARYTFPSIDLLNSPPPDQYRVTREELKANAELLEMKLLDFGVKAKVVRVTAGPVITLYELQPAPGVKVSQIVNLENDLALGMEARGIRIIAPIPGKAAVGIEIPNRKPQMVYLRSLIKSEKFNTGEFELPIAVGKAINGESFIVDLIKMPHLLIAGATGAGKSVGINTIICSLLYAVDPGKVKFVLIDPKKLELSPYRELRDHYLLYRPDLDEDVITKPNNAVSMLNTMVLEMERRQDKMHQLGVRDIREYNRKILKNPRAYKKTEHQLLPYIVIIIDELADLMMVSAKEIELPIARLAQMARAGGIHMIVATQRPSVDVITGLIKANLPARLAYQVATKIDSRTILDANGADQLLGNGDLLFKITGTAKPVRLQNPFVAIEEVEAIIRHIKKQPRLPYYSLPQPAEGRKSMYDDAGASATDPLYADARAIVVQNQSGSISLLQRRLKIGYSRAARLVDMMEEEGVVGAAVGGKPREVLMTLEELNQMS
ncbi:MAG: DNA translocase FtsK [Calditrichaeota bacterium]|nr:MAG: DNA translocase FtsK [Calditrichota bacterium]